MSFEYYDLGYYKYRRGTCKRLVVVVAGDGSWRGLQVSVVKNQVLIDVEPFVDVAVMGRHNNDGTPIGGLPQEAPQAAGIVKVLVSGGFVRHDIIRRVDERPGGRHPLPLTAGKGRYRLKGQIAGIESREYG